MHLRRIGLLRSRRASSAPTSTTRSPDLGKIGVLVALKRGDRQLAESAGRSPCTSPAADPLAARSADLDPASIERESAISPSRRASRGKPDEIIEKMVEGRMRKFYEEVVLLKQAFVIDPRDHQQSVDQAAKEVGAPVESTASSASRSARASRRSRRLRRRSRRRRRAERGRRPGGGRAAGKLRASRMR